MADPVSVASGVAGLVTLAIQVSGTVYQYASRVKDKSKNVHELRDELLLLGEVLSKLRDFLSSDEAKSNDFDGDNVLQRAVSACKDRIERIGDKLKSSDGRLGRVVDRLVWPFKEEEVRNLMDSLRRYRNTFAFAANVQGYRILSKTATDARTSLDQLQNLAKQTEDLYAQQGLVMEAAAEQSTKLKSILGLLPMLESTSDEIREVSHAMRLQELREQERRTTDILDWLCPLADLHKHKDVQGRRARGTGRWLLETDEFNSWIRGDAQDFVCVGGPGVGKSVLCSAVVDHLREEYADDNDVCVAHYYFDFAEQSLQTDVHFARSILRQICTSSTGLPSAVSTLYQKTRDLDKDRTWFRQLREVLRRVLATFTRCYIVMDAFDETEPNKQRIGLFEVINTIREGLDGVKIVATSRPHVTAIQQQFSDSTRLVVTAHEDDLRQYLNTTIDAYPDADDVLDNVLRKEVVDRLCATAGGMFLLPALNVRSILEQPTKGDVRDLLKNLSTDLTIMFNSTIERIQKLPERSKSIAFKTLMWVSHVARPLGMEELQHALAIRPEDTDLMDDRILSPRRIIDYCCGLVQFEQESNIVHLVHYTLEEYLQEHDHQLFENAHQEILHTCLRYIRLSSLEPLPVKSRVDADKIMSRMAFANYACTQWGHHARDLQVATYSDLLFPILSDSKLLLVVARVRDSGSADFRKYNDRIWVWAAEKNGGPAISLAASFGLTELVRVLISQYQEPNLLARNMYGSTALHEACLYGYEETAELLIANGADVHDTNKGKATPFYLAVGYGKLDMARQLLKHGAKQLDHPCRGGYTALHKAVELDSEPMVQFLLQAGALIGANDDRNNTPLHIAALRGSVKITRLLVLAGAYVQAENKIGLSPLDLAATAGHAAVADYLLQNESNVAHRGHDYWTALHRAARGGHIDTVVILLEYGADVLDRDHKGHLPIHHAARAGHLETVEQLLQYAPHLQEQQLFQKDGTGSTPRTIAFFCAHYDVHKYLRALEWHVLGSSTSSGNEITLAIEAGNVEKIQQLLQRGDIDLEAPDEDGQPPLHIAVQEGQREIAHMLLVCGASIEKEGYHGWRPLHIAASVGNLEMVEWCLQQGADVRPTTSSGQRPIHKAASSRSLRTVRCLLEAGADVESRNGRGMTPLQVAAHQNDIDTVRVLVKEYDADISARDRHGFTAIMWAEKSAHLEVAKFLRTEKRARERSRGNLKRSSTSNSDMRASRESLVRERSHDGLPLLEEMEMV